MPGGCFGFLKKEKLEIVEEDAKNEELRRANGLSSPSKDGIQKQMLDKPTQTSPILGGRMFAHQKSLAKLPVPPLQQTLYKYLLQLQPLVGPEEYEQTKNIVDEFGKPGGAGERLQMRLIERFSKKENWLSDWWKDVAYFEFRSPVTINVSPGVVFPRQAHRDIHGQVEFAAKFITGILDFNFLIARQNLPVDYMGGQPLCMDQYHKVLAACRIPGLKKDSFVVYPPYQIDAPHHIIVAHNNHFFAVEVLLADKTPLSLSNIYAQLRRVMEMSQVPAVPLGILTSEHRNTWGKIYKKMYKDPTNKASLQLISNSLFLVSLDQCNEHTEREGFYDNLARQCLYGGGSRSNSGNRWFDKTLQFLVRSDGGVGLTYEHASAEGPPIIGLVDHSLKFLQNNIEDLGPAATNLPEPKRLEFNLDPEILDAIEEAKHNLDVFGDELQISIAPFREFGKNYIKSQSMSPDSFIQMSFQLAFHKLHGTAPATYESGSLRKYKLGRTDTIRSCSVDSENFVRAMLDPTRQASEKVHLMRKAVTAHKAYTNDTINGDGIDRHLLGLKLTAIEAGENVPDIFMDPSYEKSMHFRVSTSQVPAKEDLTMVFGPVVPDGYGICYNPQPNHFNLAVSAFHTSPETDSVRLARAIHESLSEMRDMLENCPPQSRL